MRIPLFIGEFPGWQDHLSIEGSHDVMNLFPDPTQKWSVKDAAERARMLLSIGAMRNRKVIMVGARVAAAFGLPVGYGRSSLNALNWYGLDLRCGPQNPIMVALMPRPSSQNKWYNNPANKKRTEEFLRRLFDDSTGN